MQWTGHSRQHPSSRGPPVLIDVRPCRREVGSSGDRRKSGPGNGGLRDRARHGSVADAAEPFSWALTNFASRGVGRLVSDLFFFSALFLSSARARIGDCCAYQRPCVSGTIAASRGSEARALLLILGNSLTWNTPNTRRPKKS